MYDFIIIGAGPAGCTAAAQLAERGSEGTACGKMQAAQI